VVAVGLRKRSEKGAENDDFDGFGIPHFDRAVGHLLDMEVKRMEGFGDDPPIPPTLVS